MYTCYAIRIISKINFSNGAAATVDSKKKKKSESTVAYVIKVSSVFFFLFYFNFSVLKICIKEMILFEIIEKSEMKKIYFKQV